MSFGICCVVRCELPPTVAAWNIPRRVRCTRAFLHQKMVSPYVDVGSGLAGFIGILPREVRRWAPGSSPKFLAHRSVYDHQKKQNSRRERSVVQRHSRENGRGRERSGRTYTRRTTKRPRGNGPRQSVTRPATSVCAASCTHAHHARRWFLRPTRPTAERSRAMDRGWPS